MEPAALALAAGVARRRRHRRQGVGTALLLRRCGFDRGIRRRRDVLLLAGASFGMALAALAGSLALLLGALQPGAAFWSNGAHLVAGRRRRR
ncbi:MAG: hypothetical protein U1E53_30320 [Dongiaceae bacterium]